MTPLHTIKRLTIVGLATALIMASSIVAAQDMVPVADLSPEEIAAQEKRKRDMLLTGQSLGAEMIPLARLPEYRALMREIVIELSDYARNRDPSFAFVARPGFELLRWDKREFFLAEAKRGPGMMISEDAITPMGLPMRRFMQAIDGIALSNQFCSEGRSLPELQRFQTMGVAMMSVEHCASDTAAIQALERSQSALMISHADTDRTDMFERVPVRRPFGENPDNVETLDDGRNMLIATASRPYGSRADWLMAVGGNNYDVVVVDAFYNGKEALTKDEVHGLKFKKLGARRMVLAWLDVGYASEDRFYWEAEWMPTSPSWIVSRQPDRVGVYAIEYWHPRWKSILGRYFQGIMDLGFDGVLLNGTDAYLRFEESTALSTL